MEVHIRPWHMADIDNLAFYADNILIAQNLTNKFPHPYTRENGEVFIAGVSSMSPIQVFAIEVDGQAVGGTGIFPQDDIMCKNAELGYWLAEPYWGQGIVPQAVHQIVTYGFQTFDIDRIYARPFGGNLASQRVLEKLGFVLEARFYQTIFKFGAYQDELFYAVRRETWMI